MLAFKGPAQPSPAPGDALNAGYPYLEVRCLGCDTHQAVALDIVRRPKTTPIYELERYMRCKDCSQVRRVSIQAELSGGAQADQDYGKRSAVVLVAGGAMKSPFRTTIRGSHSQDEISATTASDKVGNQPALR
jgi:hypothetical protein